MSEARKTGFRVRVLAGSENALLEALALLVIVSTIRVAVNAEGKWFVAVEASPRGGGYMLAHGNLRIQRSLLAFKHDVDFVSHLESLLVEMMEL